MARRKRAKDWRPAVDGERVRTLREKLYRSQLDCAVAAGIHPSELSAIEHNDKDIEATRLKALCEALACSADYLLGRSGNPKPR